MVSRDKFGTMPSGEDVYSYTLTNESGASVRIIEYGAALVNIFLPDKNGDFGDVICGYDTLEGYLSDEGQYQGAVVGRVANRISNASFTLNGKEYNLDKNDGTNSLHGGFNSYNTRVWKSDIAEFDGYDTLTLTLHSPDGDCNYPGNLDITVTYTFTEDNKLTLDYTAKTDADTFVNLTNHSYFNLSGFNHGDIKNHKIKVYSDKITATDENLIPTGEFTPVDGTKYDLREFRMLTEEYDDNFVLDADGTPKLAVEAIDTHSGRGVKVYTTLPGIQIYTGNFMGGENLYKRGVKSEKHHAFCMETQYYPDTPNNHSFPSCLIKAGKEYKSTTTYAFFVEK